MKIVKRIAALVAVVIIMGALCALPAMADTDIIIPDIPPPPEAVDWELYDDKFMNPFDFYSLEGSSPSIYYLFARIHKACEKYSWERKTNQMPICVKLVAKDTAISSALEPVKQVVTPSTVYFDLRTGAITEFTASFEEANYFFGSSSSNYNEVTFRHTVKNIRYTMQSSLGLSYGELIGDPFLGVFTSVATYDLFYEDRDRYGELEETGEWFDLTHTERDELVTFSGSGTTVGIPVYIPIPEGPDYSNYSWDDVGIAFEVEGILLSSEVPAEISGIITEKSEKEKPNEKPGGSVTIDTNADDTPGEIDVSVPAAIVVGLLGTVGAVGAAGAVAGASGGDGGGDSADDEKRKKKYKMYIRKDFGDCIAYNKPQVTVYARMAEVGENGNEADRPDLTAQIQIFSGGAPVQVEGCTMAGGYMGALVCAEGAQTADRPQNGVVSFLFTGEGGTFRNNVTFRLTGEPYISFPNRGGMLEMALPMLLGDGGAYELSFEVCDFMQKPTDVRVNPQGDAPVSCEVEESGNNRYVIKLQNNSVKPDKTQASASVYAFELIAENENEHAKNRFEVHLHPEGLSVSLIKMDKGAAQVGCYRDADSPEDGDILPTRFKLELAVAETDEKGVTAAKIVPYAQYTPEFGKMTGTDTRTSVLVQRYECPVEAASENKDGLYRFCPKAQLPDPKAYAFTVNQPISAEYKGETYALELPVRLIGEPLDVMKGWDEEYKRFTRIVQYYGLSDATAASVREMAKNRSTEELRLLTKMILMESMNYYTAEHADFQRIGDQMAFLEDSFSVIKWFGDQAFSYLMTVATGPLGEAILVPAKEILVSVIAESAAAFWNGDEIDYTAYDFMKSIGGMLESIVMTQMSDATTALSPAELKKLGGILAAFLMISALKHYMTDLGPDGKPERCFYGAFTVAFSDLTASAFKMIAGGYFEKLIKSSNGQSGLGPYLLKWWKKLLPNVDLTSIKPGTTEVVLTETAKILQKLVEEYFGYAAGVFIEVPNAVLDTWSEEDRRQLAYGMAETAFAFTVPLGGGLVFAFNPGGAIEKLGDIIFDMLFDRIEFNAAPTALPPDPKYYKDGTAVV